MTRIHRLRALRAVVIVAALTAPALANAQGGIFGRIKAKAQEKIAKKIDSTADTLTGKAVDKAATAVTCVIDNAACIAQAQQQGKPVVVTDGSGKKVSTADSAKALTSAAGGEAAPAGGTGASLKSYQNYDFVPGDSIVFDDDFRADDDGEFPAHWKLLKGQGVVNVAGGQPAFVLTDGLNAEVTPRITPAAYLGATFTIEFDYYADKSAWTGVELLAHYADDGSPTTGSIVFDQHGTVTVWRFPGGLNLSGSYPSSAGAFENAWHHAALVVKNGQLKAYLDQYRVLVVPHFPAKVTAVDFSGRADQSSQIRFRNVRIANGGGMKLIDELTRDGRIVTHGIRFDVNKSDVRPESMGTIRQIVAMLQADPALKLEIDGHTDSDGDAAKNLALSQARADAVKQVLVEQGIEASRLTTKGYGATKPIASNDTPEGKANNRRVELVKR
ncbi:MAG TPA: OmpA family protein [Gemmatimonadaceae bacterium]|nr:OmpA family protein [Gemmatimonadaceae bacterium]